MKTMSHEGEPRRTTVVNEAGWGRSSRGDSTGQGGCRSSLLGHPARSFFRAPDAKIGKPPVEAARAVDAKNAPTASWKNAQNAVSQTTPLPNALGWIAIGKSISVSSQGTAARALHSGQADQRGRPRGIGVSAVDLPHPVDLRRPGGKSCGRPNRRAGFLPRCCPTPLEQDFAAIQSMKSSPRAPFRTG